MLPVEHMWPNGVRTKEDMSRFGRLIVGPTAVLEDYQARLPVADMQDTFLVVCRGGCAEGTLLANLANCVPNMMEELTRYAIDQIGNSAKPAVAYQTGGESDNHDSWYDSAQLSRSRCTCKINFGGEGQSKTRKFLNPDCQSWQTGKQFEKVLLNALQQNSSDATIGDNVYMHKAFHVLLNRTSHAANQRIGWHSDNASTYVSEDPITAMSWGATGVLLMRSKDKQNTAETALVSMHGDVYMCGGLFQRKLEHAVPPRRDWPAILQRHRATLLQIEIDALEQELRMQHVESVRQHVNVRWHTNHVNCTAHWMPHLQAAAPAVDTSQQPPVAVSVHRLNSANPNSMDGGALRLGGFFKLGTQAPITVASQAQRNPPPPWESCKSVEPLVGDTRTDPSQSSASSLVVPTLARSAPTASVLVQTDEDEHMELLQEAANDFTKLVSECFSNVDFLPVMLRMCHLAGSDGQVSAENRCLEQCRVYLMSMQSNLQQFDGLLAKLDSEGRRAHDAVIQKATSTLHRMQSALSDKHCLQEALESLKQYGCSMWETISAADDARISNQSWLQKFTMTHYDCDILMQSALETQALVDKGDIVWRMPCPWTVTLWMTDGQRVQHTWQEHEELCVRFFDIGLRSDSEVHRLHLRSDPNKVQARQRAGESLAVKLQDVIRRCAAHMRLLDYDNTGADQQTSDSPSAPAQAYSCHIWAGPNSIRQAWLNKPATSGQQKRQQTADNGSHWHADSYWQASSWQKSTKRWS